MAKYIHFRSSPVAEGVRLEIGRQTIFAVRKEDRNIAVRKRREPRKFLRSLMRVPLLRGIVRLILSIYLFMDGLVESAELRPQCYVRTTKIERFIARILHVRPQSLVLFGSGLLTPIILGLFLLAAPRGAELLLLNSFTLTRAATNTIVCIIRILGLLISIWCLGRLRGFNRLLMYRCALNKVINCCECNEDPTIENAAGYPRYARHSEAAFIISVLIVTFALISCVRVEGVLASIAARIGILFGTAALLHEPIYALERAKINRVTRLLRVPYDFFQRMTTLEPPLQVIEVAVCAFRAGLDLPGTEEEAN